MIIAMVMSAFSGICFASENEDAVVSDKEYPQLGFRAHSWITGVGSETVAHTQIIDINTNRVIKQVDNKCDYADVDVVY